MKQFPFQSFCLFLILSLSLTGVMIQPAEAQRDENQPAADAEHGDWYYGSNSKPEPKKSIAQQKAELRAQQRMDRLASLRWYRFMPGRPTASALPFTTMYSPAWTRPGGRPFAWYTGQQPDVVYARPYSYHYRYW